MLLMSGKNHRCLRQQRIVMERWVFENLGFGSDLELTLVFSSFFLYFWMIFQSGASKLRNLEKSSKMVNNFANNVEKPCSTHHLSQKPDFRELLHH